MNQNKFIKNLSFAVFAQVISLMSSFFVQLFAPKVLSVEEYAYWQLFLFYVSYINISRIGIIDGIYLKLGGKSRDELDCETLKTKWLIFLAMQVFFSTIMAVITNITISDVDRRFVLVACAICMVLINMNNFLGFLFQAIYILFLKSFTTCFGLLRLGLFTYIKSKIIRLSFICMFWDRFLLFSI